MASLELSMSSKGLFTCVPPSPGSLLYVHPGLEPTMIASIAGFVALSALATAHGDHGHLLGVCCTKVLGVDQQAGTVHGHHGLWREQTGQQSRRWRQLRRNDIHISWKALRFTTIVNQLVFTSILSNSSIVWTSKLGLPMVTMGCGESRQGKKAGDGGNHCDFRMTYIYHGRPCVLPP
jgi:hypothetical protein